MPYMETEHIRRRRQERFDSRAYAALVKRLPEAVTIHPPARSNRMYDCKAKAASGWARGRFPCPMVQKHDPAKTPILQNQSKPNVAKPPLGSLIEWAATVLRNQAKANHMKINYNRTNWLIPVLGIALVAAGVMAATTYLDLERKNHSAEASMAIIRGLHKDFQLGSALKTIHEEGVSTGVEPLDLMLCEDVIAIHSRLAALEEWDRAFIKNAFARLALIRPNSAELLSDDSHTLGASQIEAERILMEACVGTTPAYEGVAVSR
jgi:hypothetical protein